jgi:hypothetical protein
MEQLKDDRMRQATLRGMKRALAKNPDSQFLRRTVKDLEDSMKAPNPDLPSDPQGLMAMRPMD